MGKSIRGIPGIALGTMVASLALGIGSKLFLSNLGLFISTVVLLLIVFVGILFDIVGTAATAADEKPFHAMAAKRVTGSKQAIRLVRNADKVANFCNDMVGDICGTISGAVGASIVFSITKDRPALSEPILSAVVVAFIAALTVSGKAMGKGFAIRKADSVIFMAGQVLAWSEHAFRLRILSKGSRQRQANRPR